MVNAVNVSWRHRIASATGAGGKRKGKHWRQVLQYFSSCLEDFKGPSSGGWGGDGTGLAAESCTAREKQWGVGLRDHLVMEELGRTRSSSCQLSRALIFHARFALPPLRCRKGGRLAKSTVNPSPWSSHLGELKGLALGRAL